MSSECSEFVVIDDDGLQETNETVWRLNEVINLYKSAHDALVRSNILLQDQLRLALELVLQSVPPDTESNVDDLVKTISESAYTSNEVTQLRRDYVKSLCSKLVVINADYQKLSQKFEVLKMGDTSDTLSKPKLARLWTVLHGMDAMLTPPNSLGQKTEASLEEFPGTADDELDELCVFAERISSRLRTHLEGKQYKDTSCDPIPSHASKAQTTTLEPPVNVIPSESQEATRKVVQSEVSNLMQKEMQKTPERPEQPTVTKTAKPGPRKPTPKLSPMGDRPSSPRSTAARISSIPTPGDFAPGFEKKIPRKKPAPPGPAYTADQEFPKCPVCNRTCLHRVALEKHLEKCLARQSSQDARSARPNLRSSSARRSQRSTAAVRLRWSKISLE